MDKSIKHLTYILILTSIVSLVLGYFFPTEKQIFLWLSLVGFIPSIFILIVETLNSTNNGRH